MKGFRRGIAATAAVTLCLTSIPAAGLHVQAADVDQTVKLKPSAASVFNDTDGDGLGEFEGWGTSLCWWANRIGYSEKMTQEAAEAFFGDTGLDMNIGRYNVGGGDLVGDPQEVPVNEKAQIYDLETEGRTPSYAGTSMKVENNAEMKDASFTASDADFGITKGTKAGELKKIGWINKLDDAAGQGDNLRYKVNVGEAGKYTVKLLMTLTGSNTRDVAIRVNDDAAADRVVDADTINSNMIASGKNNMLFVVTVPDVELHAGENTINIAGKNDWTLDFVKMAVIKKGEEGALPQGEEFLHKAHITRSDSAVPGYAADVTKIDTSKKSIEEYQKEFARADEECGYAWNYDWDADKNQMNVLKAAAKASGQDFLAEAFSNSPPYFMTVSGCSSGNANSSKDNLRADSYNAFAAYMADVIEHWNEEGVITFQSTTPMNEPYTSYWGANSNKQEGCHFDQGESQSKIITALKKELDSKGINIVMSGTDETSIDTAITSYNRLSDEAKDAVTRIDTHTYGGSKRVELKKLAEDSGENLWMSEVDGAYEAGTNAGEMSAALGIAKQMMKDLNGMQASAWIFWNAIDMHVDDKVTTTSDADWKSLEAIYQKHDNMNKACWGLAIGDHNNEEIVLTKKYYGYGQLSRYIRPGYTIIGSGGDTLAAYDSDGKKAVIVAVNTAGEDKTWKFDLSSFSTMSDKVTAIRTSGSLADGENWADVSKEDSIKADTAKKSVTANLKANSITTYIIEGVEYDSSAEEIVSIKDVDVYTVEGIAAALPDQAEVTTNKNNTSMETVAWDLEGVDLTKDGEVTGTIKGTDIKAKAKIQVVEPNTAYFIDCNSPKSPKYAAVDAYADLRNETADQKYAEGSWGYVDDYGVYDGDVNDSYDTGWYAKSGQSIRYKVPLEAGKYQVVLGFKEWWKDGNMSRKMTVTATQNGETAELGTSDTWEGNNWWNRDFYDLTCEESGEVTFELAKVSGQPDPTLSFIEIRKVLDLNGLKAAAAKAAEVDRSAYSRAKLARMDAAVAEGRSVAVSASATQEQVDAAAKAIEDAVAALGEVYTEEQISANDYVLYLVNCGTSDASVVPDDYKRGLYQSNVDQEYGEDAGTGLSWGYEPNDEYSKIVNGGSGASDIAGSYIYMADSGVTFDKEKSGFKYRFELPKRANQDYTVTVGVKNPWDTRNVDIRLEGKTVQSDLKLTKGQLVEKTYETAVTDGELNVMVHSPKRTNQYGDPVLSYVIVKAVAAYTTDRLAASVAEKEAAVAQAEAQGRTYSEKSKAEFAAAVQAAKALIDENSKDEKAVKKALNGLEDAFNGLKEYYIYSSITGTDGARLYDNNGNKIQAHGGQIQQFTVNGETKYYWYGEDKTNGYRPVTGVHLYTSKDLYNWTDEGVALKCIPVSEEDYGKDQEEGYKADLSIFETDEYFRGLYSDYKGKLPDDTKNYTSKLEEVYWNLAEDRTVMERPKVLYNDATGKYVMWFHADGRTPTNTADYGKARAGIAVSDNPAGPFKLLGTYLLHDSKDADHSWDNEGGHLRDMNLFKDDDGQGYVVYSSDGNLTTYIAKLNAEYTGLITDPAAAVEGTGKDEETLRASDYTRNFIGASREAPAMFKYKGKYYIINSGCTGWSPNKAQYAVADHPLGPWTVKGDPCEGDSKGTTFDTQSTCVFPVDADNGKFVYMGDRWFNPDNGGDLSDSRYVWLPVEFLPDNGLKLKNYANWTLNELENKASFDVVSELPEVVSSASEITQELLPDKVMVNYGGNSADVEKEVNWTIGQLDADKLGMVEVKGTLADGNREFTHQIAVVNPKYTYFFDSGADSSEYYDIISGILGDQLKNKTPDGAYTVENGAGYLGVSEKDDKENFDLGQYAGDSYLSNGWWAKSGKNIEYAFDLEPGTYTVAAGFQEWWNTSRPSRMTVKSGDQKIAEKAFTVDRSSKDLQVNQTFEVTEETAGKIVVSISKTGNPDPVLSWIALIDENQTVIEPADKTALADKINEIRNVDLAGYTAESVAAYRETIAAALAEAEAVIDNASATQEETDAAAAKLQAAYEESMGQLVTIESVKAALAQGAEAVQGSVKEEGVYTAESWAAYQAALQNVQEVLADANISQAEADTALAALKTAAEALVEKQTLVDKTRLQAWITKVDDVLKSGQSFTAESRRAAEEALANAQAVNEKADASIAEVDEAWIGLMNAFLNLDNGAEKSGLGQAIAAAQELLANPETEKNYTAESVQGVRDALEAAIVIYEKEYGEGTDIDAAQAEINQAANALIDAVTRLLEKDYGYLISLIERAREILEHADRYTPSSVQKLEAAVTAAEQLVADKSGDADAINNAGGQILTAIAELQLRGNKAELESVLKKAEEILGNPDKYLASTLEGVKEAYDQAKAVYDNADAVQGEITDVTVKLITELMEVRILGDVDLNGRVDKADGRLMLQYSAELAEFTEEQVLVGDMDGDGRTDTADAAKVLEMISGGR